MIGTIGLLVSVFLRKLRSVFEPKPDDHGHGAGGNDEDRPTEILLKMEVRHPDYE